MNTTANGNVIYKGRDLDSPLRVVLNTRKAGKTTWYDVSCWFYGSSLDDDAYARAWRNTEDAVEKFQCEIWELAKANKSLTKSGHLIAGLCGFINGIKDYALAERLYDYLCDNVSKYIMTFNEYPGMRMGMYEVLSSAKSFGEIQEIMHNKEVV